LEGMITAGQHKSNTPGTVKLRITSSWRRAQSIITKLQHSSIPGQNTRLAIPADVRASLHDHGIVLLSLRRGHLFAGNRAVTRIWNRVLSGETIAGIAGHLSTEYGIAIDQALNDTTELIVHLERQGLLKRLVRPRPIGTRCLLLETMWELIRYDFLMAFFGFSRIHSELNTHIARDEQLGPDGETRIGDALATVSSIYWKPVRCLQRSVVLVRLLRKRGVPAELVIGYNTAPFFSHAWVSIKDRVFNDSQAYASRLIVLDRIRASDPGAQLASAQTAG